MTSPDRTASRARLLAVGLLILAFGAGALGGVAADRLFGARAPAADRPLPRAGGPPPGRGGLGAGAIFPAGIPLGRQLDLTPEQRQRIVTILAADRAKADSVLRAVRPVLQARYDSTSDAIRAVLSVEQRARFDSLRETRRDRIRRSRRAPP